MAQAFFTEDQIELLSATTVRCDFVVRFDFVSGAVFAWNGHSPLSVGGNTYKPMHGLGQIEGLEFTTGEQSQAVTLSVNGLPDQSLDFLAAALAESPEVEQQLVTISLQLFGSDWQPVGTPIPVFYGYMQPLKISRAPMQGTDGARQGIQIVAENIFYNRALPPYGRNTDRDQQARSPGDKFFGFVASLVNKTIRYPDF